MPLSEEELRALEQMERALVQEDPKLASTLRGTNLRRAARRRAILAGFCFVVGLGVLMTGAIGRVTLVGILGFVIMLASATLGLSAWRGRQAASEKAPTEGRYETPDSPAGLSVIQGGRSGRKPRRTGGGRPKGASRQSFMQRLEERWQRRRDQNGF